MAQNSSNNRLIIVCVAVGLLIGAGVVIPFAVNYRNSMQKAQRDAVAAAALAETNKQEAVALEKQKAEMRENLGVAEKAITGLKTDLEARGGELDALRKVDALRKQEVDTLKADVQQKAAVVADLTERLALAKGEIESATAQSEKLNTIVNGLRSEVSRMSETMDVQRTEIAKLVEAVKAEETAKVAAIQRAEVAETKVVETHAELMTLAPVRIEERYSTLKKRKLAEKAGVPLGGLFDGIGDAFQGIGEGLFGKSGPVILVAVYKDGHEETLDAADAQKWESRGIVVVKLAEVRRS